MTYLIAVIGASEWHSIVAMTAITHARLDGSHGKQIMSDTIPRSIMYATLAPRSVTHAMLDDTHGKKIVT